MRGAIARVERRIDRRDLRSAGCRTLEEKKWGGLQEVQTSAVKWGIRAAEWVTGDANPFALQIAFAQEAERSGYQAVFFGDRLLSTVSSTGGQVYAATHSEVLVTLASEAFHHWRHSCLLSCLRDCRRRGAQMPATHCARK